MALISISQVKLGDRLAHDVLTERNNTLLLKGTAISQRELDIMHAFLIMMVEVEGEAVAPDGEGAASSGHSLKENASLVALYAEYDKLLALSKRVFSLAATGGAIPVLDIRNQVEALLAHIDSYDLLFFRPSRYTPQDYLYHNSVRVAMTAYTLARWHGLPQKDLIPITLAGLMHDIGNAKIDQALLAKRSPLTKAEFDEIRSHTIAGYAILKNVAGFNEGTKLTALQHHEREDGSGYPHGLKKDKIHPYAKVVAIADIYHAMSSNRLYRSAVSPYLVLEELLQYSFGKLDPLIVRTFIDKVTQFHNGMIVKLSDNRIGEIIFSQREHPTRPWVNVDGTIVNLTTERRLYIQDVIQK